MLFGAFHITPGICYVPDETKTNYHRVIGNFAGGENAPKSVNELLSNFLNPAMTHQVDIIVKEKAQDVFIQLLLDCTGKSWAYNITPPPE